MTGPTLENNVKREKAIDVMKIAIEELSKTKTRKIPLFKPRRNKKDNMNLQNKMVKKGNGQVGIRKQKTKIGKKFRRK